jgi:hypothetical protein
MAETKDAVFSPMTEVLTKAVGLRDAEEITTPEIAAAQVKRFKEVEKALEEYTPSFKNAVFNVAQAYGVVDEKGNATITLADGSGYKKEVRQSVAVDQEAAVKLFREKDMALYVQNQYTLKEGVDLTILAANLPEAVRARYFDVKEVVPESSIEEAFLLGKITDEELASTITKKVINALKEVKPKKKK